MVPLEYVSALGHNVFPMQFRLMLFGLVLVNLAVVVIFEKFVVLGAVRRWIKTRKDKE
jgi:hypothetical protein